MPVPEFFVWGKGESRRESSSPGGFPAAVQRVTVRPRGPVPPRDIQPSFPPKSSSGGTAPFRYTAVVGLNAQATALRITC